MSGAFFVVCHRLHASKNLIHTIYMLLSAPACDNMHLIYIYNNIRHV